jgi:phage terminase large subunit-like protein
MSAIATPRDQARAEVIAAALRRRNRRNTTPAERHPYQQPPPGDWDTWAIVAGRGSGKTFAGAEWIIDQIAGNAGRIALIAPTSADARDVMVEGPSGIIRRAVARNWPRPTYEPSKRKVTFHNGAVAFTYSAEEPDRLRGPQHDAAWGDELAAWKYIEETLDNLMYGMREGVNPRKIFTTTPRPVAILRKLIRDGANPDSRTVVTRASLYDNADNLPQSFIDEVTAAHGGTRKGRQEIEGELLEDVEGALWNVATIDRHRLDASKLRFCEEKDGSKGDSVIGISHNGVDVDFVRVVVGVDPAATSNDESNETGIVVVAAGNDKRGYVLADLSLRGQPLEWASRAAYGYHLWDADALIVETNNGGEMVRQTVVTADNSVSVQEVHASKGKMTRAEPISALYEQGHISHVGQFSRLEDQMTNFVPGMVSPDRMDAMVWASTALLRHIGTRNTGGFL